VEEEEEGRGYHIDIATEAEKERIEENCGFPLPSSSSSTH
jgi:hypothetical protein